MILQSDVLKAFIAIVKSGTVHSAAENLGLTQTAVTQRLKSLESTLNLTLFIRSRRGMELTDDGRALFQYCKATEELEGRFMSQVTGTESQEINLTIIGPTSSISTRVTENVKGLYERHPKLRLHLQARDDINGISAIRKGMADLAIVRPDQVPNEMESKMLKPDLYLLVSSSAWKGRKLSEIIARERAIDFYEGDTMTERYLKKFKIDGTLRSRLFVNDNEALLRFFKSGVGYGTLTESVAAACIETGDLCVLNRGQVLEDPLALVWYKRSQIPKYFSDIIHSIK